MNYGFLINNRTCIGCHACSTACKSENDVPLGVYRTWVKYTEVGAYPDVQRHFQVTRCNHCANPPCVRICPTTAMYRRDDGIVEFDSDACIGCKACMQACPYDAIHIDPTTNTAAKCHYCSHRTDIGLEPACVVVCPEHAIVAGDLDDPDSEISRVLARESVTVRKPEQGTQPKLYYVGGMEASMQPTTTAQPSTFMFADAPDDGFVPVRRAEQMVQVGYNAQHKAPWHWPVPAYLVTKGIASGLALVLVALYALGQRVGGDASLVCAIAALVMMMVTTALLVSDLERPERFLRVITRPQTQSWLVRGAYILIAYSTLIVPWILLEAGVIGDSWQTTLYVLLVPLAIATAVYTAFLLGQAEGRDLWQSPLLPVHFLVQAWMAGSAFLLIVQPFVELGISSTWVRWFFLAGVALDAFVILIGELGMSHSSDVATAAAKEITKGRYRSLFWYGVIAVGHVGAPALVFGNEVTAAFGGLLALIGLYCFEHAYVMAPQRIPNS